MKKLIVLAVLIIGFAVAAGNTSAQGWPPPPPPCPPYCGH